MNLISTKLPPYSYNVALVLLETAAGLKRSLLLHMMISPINHKVSDLERVAELMHCFQLIANRGATKDDMNRFFTRRDSTLKRSPVNAIKHGKFGDVLNVIEERFPT